MLHDIEICRKLNCDGVVIGMLNTDGNIDMDRSSKLMDAAGSMQVTFHRAFDRVKDPLNALEQIISLGCKRILTSGLKPNVNDGANFLSVLVKAAGDRICIMPGSGVRAENIIQLAELTGAKAFHSSARKMVESEMIYTNVEMNESLQQVSVDGDEVRKIKDKLDLHFNK